MNGIKEVGFANAISAANPYNAFAEIKFLMKIIFELKK
jgi:hypothetical protein